MEAPINVNISHPRKCKVYKIKIINKIRRIILTKRK